MSALKEFADFITLNMANLAATYAQLLAESNAGYEIFPADSRITSARKLLKAVIKAYDSQTSEPLVGLFEAHTNENSYRWAEHIDPPYPLAEIECLGQTLTPVVTNLEAGKFLWDMLLELRTTVHKSIESKPPPPIRPAIEENVDKMVLPRKVEDKLGQAPLPDSETHFRKIFDHSNDAIFVVDPIQDKILDINTKACTMLGYSRAELLALSYFDIHLHVLPQLMAFVQSVVEQGYGWTNELALMTKSGKPLPAEISASIIELDGNPSLIALVRDSSERKESEQRFKELINDLPIGVYRNTPGPGGHFLEANPAIVAMFEADTTEEFLKHNVSDLYQDPKDRERFSEKLLEVGYIKDEELRLKTLKGRELWGSVTAVMRKDAQEQPYFDGLIVDITERKRIEVLSQESEERYRLFLDLSPDPIVIYDTKGQVIYINSAFAQTFGWFEDELRGKRLDFVPEENWPETRIALEQLATTGKVLGFETKRFTKDGRILEVQQSGAIIKDKDGNPTGSVIFTRDITDLKAAQETTQRQAQREQTIREITEKMRRATTLDELVKTTAEELGKRLSVGHAVVQLGIDESVDASAPQDNGRE